MELILNTNSDLSYGYQEDAFEVLVLPDDITATIFWCRRILHTIEGPPDQVKRLI